MANIMNLWKKDERHSSDVSNSASSISSNNKDPFVSSGITRGVARDRPGAGHQSTTQRPDGPSRERQREGERRTCEQAHNE